MVLLSALRTVSPHGTAATPNMNLPSDVDGRVGRTRAWKPGDGLHPSPMCNLKNTDVCVTVIRDALQAVYLAPYKVAIAGGFDTLQDTYVQ